MVRQMWADPNLKDFQGRVTRIEKAHAKGYGFEAKGTLGRSSTWRHERSGRRYLYALLLITAAGVTLKGAIHYYVGSQAYQERVDGLSAGEGFDRIAATIMQADPVTLAISATLGRVFGP